jgi:hypothetical protein
MNELITIMDSHKRHSIPQRSFIRGSLADGQTQTAWRANASALG